MHPGAKITGNTEREIRPHPTSKPYQVLGQTTLHWTFSAQEPFRETIFTVLDGPHDGTVFSFQVLLENYVFRNKYAGIRQNKKVSKREVNSNDEGELQATSLWAIIFLLLAVVIFLFGLTTGLLICILLFSVFHFRDFLVKGKHGLQVSKILL